MSGRLYIDGVNIYKEFGIFVADGGYTGLISPAGLKEIEYNDWPEMDGIEPDLSNPMLDSKDFSLPFYSVNNKKTEDFLAFLSEESYHSFEFLDIQKESSLRLLNQPGKETISRGESFSLKFADDFPMDGYTYLSPIGSINQSGFEIDNKPLSDYGVLLLAGSYDEIMKSPSVKKNLSHNYRNSKGLVYDNDSVVYQHKDVALKCLLVAANLNTFWRNFNALIYDLIRPNQRQFYVGLIDDTFPCYYKGCRVNQFSKTSKAVWCEFTLTLVFTDFRPKFNVAVIGTEDHRIVISEDLINAFLITDYLPKVEVLGTEDLNIIATEDLNKILIKY